MPVFYAGVELTAMTPELRAECDAWWAAHFWPDDCWENAGWFGRDMHQLPIPGLPPRVRVRPGVLYWPNGSSRWAVFHHFVTIEQLDRIRLATRGTAGPFVDGINLVLSSRDDPRKTVTTPMYMLPPRPVKQQGRRDLYLMTLVDLRYFWSKTAGGVPVAISRLWSDYFPSDWDGRADIPAAYGLMSSRWDIFWGLPPLAWDAAAATVGMRVIRSPSTGTTTLTLPAAALTSDDAQYETWAGEVSHGGRFDLSDIAAMTGSRVDVYFNTLTGSANTFVTRDSLALPQYDGLPASRDLADVQMLADLDGGASSGDRDDYAEQAASDFYLWALARTDCTFRGIVPWEPTGLEDRIEWEHTPDRVCTRIVRHGDTYSHQFGTPRVAGLDGATDTVAIPFRKTESTGLEIYDFIPPPGTNGTYTLQLVRAAGPTYTFSWV